MTTIQASQSGVSVGVELQAPQLQAAQSGVSVGVELQAPQLQAAQSGVSVGVELQAPQLQASQSGLTVIVRPVISAAQSGLTVIVRPTVKGIWRNVLEGANWETIARDSMLNPMIPRAQACARDGNLAIIVGGAGHRGFIALILPTLGQQ